MILVSLYDMHLVQKQLKYVSVLDFVITLHANLSGAVYC